LISQESSKPKKILSLDGGGIRGVITIEILIKIEQLLRTHYQDEQLVLADYFDFIAGTSTGAIIGTGLSLGMSMQNVRQFYMQSGKDMFDRASWLTRIGSLFGHKYNDRKLARKLQEVFGKDTTLGSDTIKTMLMIVMHNVKTNSPWPITNNPKAKFNDLNTMGVNSNLHLPLWQLVRASTAAPTYFPPEKIIIEGDEFLFIDGAVTPYQNPAFQAFIMATLNAYQMNWSTGQDKLMILSIGTGNNTLHLPELDAKDMHLFHHLSKLPGQLMNAAQYQQDMLCRVFGDCRVGYTLDSEIGNLQNESAQGSTPEKLFTYIRYNIDISEAGFQLAGIKQYNPNDIKHLDAVGKMDVLHEIGELYADHNVKIEHLKGFL